MQLLILGIGQTLRSDDGAGPAAVKYWEEHFLTPGREHHIQVRIEELPGLTLVEWLRGSRAVIVADAVLSGAAPGKIHLLNEKQLASFISGGASAHGLGIAEALALGRALYPEEMPESIRFVGIEAGNLQPGMALSRPVLEAIPAAAQHIQALVESWLSTPGE
jgi:hydrogenase maturation protease